VSRTARAGRCLSGHILGGSISALLVDCLQFTDFSYGLQFVLIWHLAPPRNGFVFVFLVIFSVCNLLCSFVFHFTHFILFHFLLLYFICLLYYFIIVYLLIHFGVLFIWERLQ